MLTFYRFLLFSSNFNLPRAGRTGNITGERDNPSTLTHAPAQGELTARWKNPLSQSNFNPRPLHGGEPKEATGLEDIVSTLTHAPYTGANLIGPGGVSPIRHFNPRPLHGGEPRPDGRIFCDHYFNPRPLHGGERLILDFLRVAGAL